MTTPRSNIQGLAPRNRGNPMAANNNHRNDLFNPANVVNGVAPSVPNLDPTTMEQAREQVRADLLDLLPSSEGQFYDFLGAQVKNEAIADWFHDFVAERPELFAKRIIGSFDPANVLGERQALKNLTLFRNATIEGTKILPKFTHLASEVIVQDDVVRVELENKVREVQVELENKVREAQAALAFHNSRSKVVKDRLRLIEEVLPAKIDTATQVSLQITEGFREKATAFRKGRQLRNESHTGAQFGSQNASAASFLSSAGTAGKCQRDDSTKPPAITTGGNKTRKADRPMTMYDAEDNCFKFASPMVRAGEEVLKKRRIVKAKRPGSDNTDKEENSSSGPNPFAGTILTASKRPIVFRKSLRFPGFGIAAASAASSTTSEAQPATSDCADGCP